MRLRDHYDWVVLGDHPGALLSACLAAKLGLSVLVLPMGSTLSRLISRSGQFFDPEANYMLGLNQVGKVSGLTLACLNRLGMQSEDLAFIQENQQHPQVLTPQTRIVLSPTDQLLSEFQREFGKPSTQKLGLISALKGTELEFLSFWEELPKRFTLNSDRKKTISRPVALSHLHKKLTLSLKSGDGQNQAWLSIEKHISDLSQLTGRSDLAEVFAGFWYFVTSSVNPDPDLFHLLHALSISRTAASFTGGMTAYRLFLLNLAKKNGAHIPPKTECRRIFIERGRFAGVQITTRGSMISSAGGVLGCSLNRALLRATYTGRRWFRKKPRSPVPIGWRFTLAITLHQEAIPVGLLSRAVWQEKGAPTLEIETVDPKEYKSEETGNRIVYLRTVMPYTQESLSIEFQKLVAARMLRQAIEIIPFMEFHLTRIYPDFRLQEVTVDELTEAYGFSSLDVIPDNLLVYRGKGLSAQTGIDGLFSASDESYPEWGSLGGTIAAVESVAWLAHRSGFLGPMG